MHAATAIISTAAPFGPSSTWLYVKQVVRCGKSLNTYAKERDVHRIMPSAKLDRRGDESTASMIFSSHYTLSHCRCFQCSPQPCHPLSADNLGTRKVRSRSSLLLRLKPQSPHAQLLPNCSCSCEYLLVYKRPAAVPAAMIKKTEGDPVRFQK